MTNPLEFLDRVVGYANYSGNPQWLKVRQQIEKALTVEANRQKRIKELEEQGCNNAVSTYTWQQLKEFVLHELKNLERTEP